MVTRIIVSGLVQGVGFRQFIKEQADLLGITGFTRNTDDGRVEAVFAGEKRAIEKMVGLCKKGPHLAKVEEILVTWEKGRGEYGEFVIL
jgi:acylphosphatase